MDSAALGSLFTQAPVDWFIIGAVILAVALDALRSGTNRACALTLALPAVLMLFSASLREVSLGSLSIQLSSPMLRAIIFGALLIAIYLLIRRMFGSYDENGAGFMNATVAGIATVVVLITVWLQVPELQSLWHFGPTVQNVFNELYGPWWILGAYAALAFARS